MRAVVFGAVVLSLLLWLDPAGGVRAAQTLNVPADYSTIQSAINAAVNGDTVLVSPGTYFETINFQGKAITVTSAAGAQTTVIDGGNVDSVVTFAASEGPGSILDGFTIQHGRSGFDTPGFGTGGGVRTSGTSPTIANNTIANNTACSGAGISIYFGAPLIEKNVIRDNYQSGCSGGGGGGIWVFNSSGSNIVGNVIDNNTMLSSGGGGGIGMFNGEATIVGNRITRNKVAGTSCSTGGGISFVNDGGVRIVQNLIAENEADCGGGIAASVSFGSDAPTMVSNTIASNLARTGMGIYLTGYYDEAILENNIIAGDNTTKALHCISDYSPVPPVLKNNIFYANGNPPVYGICEAPGSLQGNLMMDPILVNPGVFDYRLSLASPAIDAGDNQAPFLPTLDFDGNPRILDSDGDAMAVVDMGAYEATGVDSDSDGVPDGTDVCPYAPGPASSGGCPVTSAVGGSVEYFTNADHDGYSWPFAALAGLLFAMVATFVCRRLPS